MPPPAGESAENVNQANASAAIYASGIAPLFKAKCVRCHDEKTHKGRLDLSSPAGIEKGSESGEIIDRGKPDQSLLYEMVREGRMPPDGQDPLSTDEIATIARWIEQGAEFDQPAAAASKISQRQVLPFLYLRCVVCHGLRRQEGQLDLRTRESMLKGGKSGPAIVPGNSAESLVVKRITAGEMPPPRRLVEVSVKTMEPNELALVAAWIDQGAPEEPEVVDDPSDSSISDADRQFWSFQPPKRPAVPDVKNADRIRNPIDAFILRKLEETGLSLSPEADRLKLLRRAYFDLTGLPPEPDAIASFASDSDPLAYEKAVDRLLDSPHYGERWASYWLDLAGYSDSEGVQNSDPIRPFAWRYRDYVIRSLNADKPYDRFLLEQIAGDELADYEHAPEITDEIHDNLVATGFLRMAPDGTFSAITAFAPDRLDIISAEIEVLSSSVMGMTLRCARCHSHKFDPIPQRDYYRLAAIFKGAYDEHDWLKPNDGGQGSLGHFDVRWLPHVATKERRAWEAEKRRLDAAIGSLKATLDEQAEQRTRIQVDKLIAQLPEALREDLRKMLATPADKRDTIQKYLAEKFEPVLKIERERLVELDPEYKQLSEQTQRETAPLEAERKPEPMIRALWDRGSPSPTYVLRRGNYLTPGEPVGPGVPFVFSRSAPRFFVTPPWPGANKTGRRLAFARWLTHPEHPLTARVMVNRIWKHHFGTGLVATLDNFGKTGTPPTHPELLDWLAVEFVKSGLSIKSMHRLIMTSSVYRQSSAVSAVHERLDPENRLLSRMPLRRLEAEALRDTLLSVSGRLDSTPFGPADGVDRREDGLVTPRGTARGWRRSIYLQLRRTEMPTFLETFDLPRMNPNCVARTDSNVAPQALYLLNDRGIRQLADSFAARVLSEHGTDRDRQITSVYLWAFGRVPTDDERKLAVESLARLQDVWRKQLESQTAAQGNLPAATTPAERAMSNFCHAMMNSAELLYID